MQKIILSIFILGLVSCATSSHKTRPLKYSLSSVKQAAKKNIPAKVSHTSPNGREIYFELFPMPDKYAKRKGYTKDGKFLEKAKTKVVVLGERRPYEVEVTVKVMSLGTNGKYYFHRESKPFARFLAKKIEQALVKRHEKLNLINDFRAF